MRILSTTAIAQYGYAWRRALVAILLLIVGAASPAGAADKPANRPTRGKAVEKRAADKPVERLGLDPILLGIWTTYGSSEDKGKTVVPVEPPTAICRAYATKVLMADGKEYKIAKVFIVKDATGNPGNMVFFENGRVWAISKQSGSPFFLVQMLDGELDEMMRFVVTIEE